MKSSPARTFLVVLFGATLCLAIALAFVISRHRNYQVDEIEHIHSAFNVSQGQVLYRDFWEGHNPLLYWLLQPFIDPTDPAGTFGSARGMMFVILLGIVGLTAFITHRLAGTTAALLASGLLLTHTTFVERAIEIRPDPFLTLAAVSVLALELSSVPALRRFTIQAVALSFAFLTTQKAVLVAGATGLIWLLEAWRTRRIAHVMIPCIAFAVPVSIAACWIWSTGAWSSYVEYNWVNQAKQVGRASSLAFSPWASLLKEGKRNLFFCAIGAFGVAYTAIRIVLLRFRTRAPSDDRKQPPTDEQRSLVLVLVFSVFLIASLWINPFPFPYFHVVALPGMAVLAACSIQWATVRWQSRCSWLEYVLGLAVLGLALVTSFPRLLSKAVDRTEYQMAFMRQIHAVTPTDGTVFDLAGLHFRRDPYPVFVMTMPMVRRYKSGAFARMVPLLRENHVDTIIRNYRTTALGKEEDAFIQSHFAPYTYLVLLPGREITALKASEKQSFQVLQTRTFRFKGTGRLLVDDREFSQGILEAGNHILSTNEPSLTGTLLVDVPPPVLDDTQLHQLLYPTFD